MATNEPVRRRRRVRTGDGDPETEAVGQTAAVADEPVVWGTEPDVETASVERGLRGLVGGGSSQVSPAAALRARDAARPRPEDVARAEADLTIVRRHWTPRD
jgi:hypothetical protein